jgi:putative ABC transport system permease protein
MKAAMDTRDLLRLAWGSVVAHRVRSRLTVLGIVIGIASVILLTSLGEGTRRAILSDFTQFGTNIMAINKGKRRTSGMPGIGATVRRLTIEDAEALRRVRGVEKILLGAYGSARVEFGERGRDVLVAGVTSEMPAMFRFPVRQGRFLPPGDPRRAAPLAVLGPRVKRELFGEANALGEHVRIGGRRFVVIGVMEPKGQFLGLDMDDRAYIAVASAQSLFHQDELSEIHVLFSGQVPLERIKAGVRRVLMDRHGGEEDFTITTQTEMLDVLDRILSAVTVAVAGIAAVSLLVGAIGILTIMWISVGERTSEIGLAKAIGAGRAQILRLFLLEAALLSLAGGALGVAAGMGLGRAIRFLLPSFPFHTQPGFVALALAVSLAVGLLSGVLPARRAADLDPLQALRAE